MDGMGYNGTTSCKSVYEKLNRKFPNQVKSVLVDFDGPKVSYVVVFMNGHTLFVGEKDINTDDFFATCAMVYDL